MLNEQSDILQTQKGDRSVPEIPNAPEICFRSTINKLGLYFDVLRRSAAPPVVFPATYLIGSMQLIAPRHVAKNRLL